MRRNVCNWLREYNICDRCLVAAATCDVGDAVLILQSHNLISKVGTACSEHVAPTLVDLVNEHLVQKYDMAQNGRASNFIIRVYQLGQHARGLSNSGQTNTNKKDLCSST